MVAHHLIRHFQPGLAKGTNPVLSAGCPVVQVMWTMGGTWLLFGTVVEVTFLYFLDQL